MNGNVDAIVKQLKEQNGTNELHNGLNQLVLLNRTSLDNLKISSVLLNDILPDTYSLMDNNIKRIARELIGNYIGVGQLLGEIRRKESLNKIFYEILKDIVISDNLNHLFKDLNASSVIEKEIRSLIVLKIPEALNKCFITNSDDGLKSIISDYSIKVFKITLQSSDVKENVKFAIIVGLIRNDLKLMKIVFEDWNEVSRLYNRDSKENKRRFCKCLFDYLSREVYDGNSRILSGYFTILNDLSFKDFTEFLIGLCADSMNALVSGIFLDLIKTDRNDILNQLKKSLVKFGNKNYINQTGIMQQEEFTKFIILLCNILNNNDLLSISNDHMFLGTITNRLESKLNHCRSLGMILADFIYEKLNGKPMFTINSYTETKKSFLKFIIPISNISLIPVSDAFENILSDSNLITDLPTQEASIEESPIMVSLNYESDPEDSDNDDPSVSRRPQVAKPVYIKDLVHYLETDSQKDTTAYEKREIAFSIGIQMIRIKKRTPEIKFYANKLFNVLINLTDFGFVIKEGLQLDKDSISEFFNAWKLSFMIALCVCEPDASIKYLLQGFIQEDWSISIRIMILSCIGLTCRELSGEHDDFVLGKTDLNKVGPNRLSGIGHVDFLKLEDGDNSWYETLEKIVDASGNKEVTVIKKLQELGMGQVIRKSRKLDLDKEVKIGSTRNVSYINKGLPKLYYSLVGIWQEINSETGGKGFMMGEMSDVLNAHYLGILSMIYECGVPSCIELIEMSKELLLIIVDQLRSIKITTSEEFPQDVLASVLKCIKVLVVGNHAAMQVIKTQFIAELYNLLELLVAILHDDGIVDDSVRNNCVFVAEELRRLIL